MPHKKTRSIQFDNSTKNYIGCQMEVNNMPGKTIPDQSLTVRQIMQRHTAGVPLNVKTPQFHNEDEIDNYNGKDPRTMDLVELHEELQEIGERQKARIKLAEEMAENQKKQEEQEKIARLKSEWQKEQEALKNANQ